jgi:trimeric autotransporter adhesin
MKKSRTSAMPLGALASAALLAFGTALPAVAWAQARGAASATSARVAPAAAAAAAAHPSRAFWLDARGTPAAVSSGGARSAINASRVRAVTLDKLSLAGLLQAAPAERSAAARQSPLVMVLPDPAGGYQRFAVVDSPVMEAGLAARHPEIKTYAGRGIDDPSATLRMSVTPLGVQASVRSTSGAWYVEPYYQLDQSLYASYYRADVQRRVSSFSEGLMRQAQVALSRGRYHAGNEVKVEGLGFIPNSTVTITVRQAGQAIARQTVYATASEDGTLNATFKADPYRALGSYEVTLSDGRSNTSSVYEVVADSSPLMASVGSQLRTYRLALVSDPAYANFFGAANVTAAKVALMNRVNQVYEDDLSVRMVLVANNDVLNLNTAAQFSGANGPCGGTACYPSASVSCSSATLTRTRTVIGLLVGASNFDIGHIGVGAGGGGIASLGVVGLAAKAQGCTGLPNPDGDVFAIDYVAHEMGHQFAGNHTFNGVTGSCSGGNRSANNSVEPGSGTSVMAYAGICGTDNTQNNSDPYFSMRSFDEITTHIGAPEQNLTEVQQAALTAYVTNGQEFVLRYNGADSAPIVRGTNFTTAGIQAAIQAIPGWPAGGTVSISGLTDTGFTIGFGGALAGVDAGNLQLVGCTGCTGYIGEITKGGISARGGSVTATGNTAPTVTAPAAFTIPLRTPFALTGSATDPDGDTVTYMWEQTDRGGASGTGLPNNVKTNGPLFRQFGTRAVFNANVYNPVGQNQTDTNPTRVFPDMPQILANNTNAEAGTCTAGNVDCFSEFLPTADYVGFAGVNASPTRLNFRLTARDGRGGVNSAGTVLTLAAGTGPFLVTFPNAGESLDAGSPVTVTWAVAGTNAAPVAADNVKISMSTDGGLTYPLVMAASTPNDGSQKVTVPLVNTSTARIKVEAVGNVFFDVSNTNLTVVLRADLTGDGAVDCSDLAVVKALIGKRVGDPGFDPRADFNNDGIIDARDLGYVAQRVTVGVRCAP